MAINITRNGLHRLMRGTTQVSQHSAKEEAYERASRQPAGTYNLITADETIVVTGTVAPPPPAPVNCAGTWGAWVRVAGSEGACVNGSRTFTESRTFAVTTQPANGGTACPVSPETRTQTEACTVTPPPPPPHSASTADIQARLLNFAQVWKRNWNHGGHTCVLGVGAPGTNANPFSSAYGYWEYAEGPATAAGEPWLFDRATAGMRLYQMTNDEQWRTQFRADLAWYAARIDAAGIFTPKGAGDTKYSYITPLVLGVAAGDMTAAAARPIADRIYAAWQEWPGVADLASGNLWTERENGLALEAAVAYYELTQSPAALVRAQALVDQWDAVIAQTGNMGAPRVTYGKHEGGYPGGAPPPNPEPRVSSPWMSALYFQAARRFVVVQPSAAAQVHRQASAYFDYLDTPYNGQTYGFADGTVVHPENAGFVYPAYLTETLIGDSGYGPEHALDVAGVVAFAVRAKEALGHDTTRAVLRLNQMKATAARFWSNASGQQERTTTWLPRYRVMPARSGNWLIRGLYELVQLGL